MAGREVDHTPTAQESFWKILVADVQELSSYKSPLTRLSKRQTPPPFTPRMVALQMYRGPSPDDRCRAQDPRLPQLDEIEKIMLGRRAVERQLCRMGHDCEVLKPLVRIPLRRIHGDQRVYYMALENTLRTFTKLGQTHSAMAFLGLQCSGLLVHWNRLREKEKMLRSVALHDGMTGRTPLAQILGGESPTEDRSLLAHSRSKSPEQPTLGRDHLLTQKNVAQHNRHLSPTRVHQRQKSVPSRGQNPAVDGRGLAPLPRQPAPGTLPCRPGALPPIEEHHSRSDQSTPRGFDPGALPRTPVRARRCCGMGSLIHSKLMRQNHRWSINVTAPRILEEEEPWVLGVKDCR